MLHCVVSARAGGGLFVGVGVGPAGEIAGAGFSNWNGPAAVDLKPLEVQVLVEPGLPPESCRPISHAPSAGETVGQGIRFISAAANLAGTRSLICSVPQPLFGHIDPGNFGARGERGSAAHAWVHGADK